MRLSGIKEHVDEPPVGEEAVYTKWRSKVNIEQGITIFEF